MLSGKGDENGEKTTIGLISNFARAALFLYISLPLFCATITETSRNFLVTDFME